MKDFAKVFYGSRLWHECRDSYIQKRCMIDGGMCEVCHQNLGYIVHHKIELNPLNITDPDIALNHNNFEYVCLDCHNKIHDVGMNHGRTFFDENGDIHPYVKEPNVFNM